MTVFFKRQLQIFLMFVLVSVNLYVLGMVLLASHLSNAIDEFKEQYIEQEAEPPYVPQRAKMRDNRSYEQRQLDAQQRANLYKQLMK